jgi:hypothetical protein
MPDPKYGNRARNEGIGGAVDGDRQTHQTERKQLYTPGPSKHQLDRQVPDVAPQDLYDQGEPMRRGMQGGDAEINEYGAPDANDPVARARDPRVRGHAPDDQK